MTNKRTLIGLDVGERRIGVAVGDSIGRIASPLTTLEADGLEIVALQRLLLEHEATELVIGLPRNMSGEQTQQTEAVKSFVIRRLLGFELPVSYQDESLTSVLAERELKARGKPYTKADIDALAATLILQDYIEARYGH